MAENVYEIRFIGDPTSLVQASKDAEHAFRRLGQSATQELTRAAEAGKQLALQFDQRQLALPITNYKKIAGAVTEAGQSLQEYASRQTAVSDGTVLFEGTTRQLTRAFRLAAFQVSSELSPAMGALVMTVDRAAMAWQLSGGSMGLWVAGAVAAGSALALLLRQLNLSRQEANEFRIALESGDPGKIAAQTEKYRIELAELARTLREGAQLNRDYTESLSLTGEPGAFAAGPDIVTAFRLSRMDAIIERGRQARQAEKFLLETTEEPQPLTTDRAYRIQQQFLQAAAGNVTASNQVLAIRQQILQVEAQLLQINPAANTEEQTRATQLLNQVLDLQLTATKALAAAQAEADPLHAKWTLAAAAATERLTAVQKRLNDERLQYTLRAAELQQAAQTAAAMRLQGEAAEELSRRILGLIFTLRSATLDESVREIERLDGALREMLVATAQLGPEAQQSLRILITELERLTAVRKAMIAAEERERPAGGDTSLEGLLGVAGAAQHRARMALFREITEAGMDITEGMKRQIEAALTSQWLEKQAAIVARYGETLGEQFVGGFTLGLLTLKKSIGTFGEMTTQATINIGNALTRGLDDTFFNVVTGRFQGLVDTFRQVGYAIVREATNISAQLLSKQLFDAKGAGGGGGLLGGLFGWLMGLFGGGGGGSFVGMQGATMQHGGVVTRPTLAMLGEAGPEAVIPLSKLGKGDKSGDGGTTVINLTDRDQLAIIVAQEMARGREVVVNDVIQGLRGNAAIRRGIRRFA